MLRIVGATEVESRLVSGSFLIIEEIFTAEMCAIRKGTGSPAFHIIESLLLKTSTLPERLLLEGRR
jgi:hypothetical protein